MKVKFLISSSGVEMKFQADNFHIRKFKENLRCRKIPVVERSRNELLSGKSSVL